MKKIKLLFCFSLFILHSSFSFGQTWLWSTNLYTKTPDDPVCPIATDKSGNAYVTGSTQTDTLHIGNTKFTGKYSVTYLAKYNPAGGVVWAKQLTGNVSTSGIATDKSGNFYVSGNFGDTLKIGSSTLITPFNNCVFLAKFDSNGNPLWAKQCQTYSRSCYVGISFIATDIFNNVFATGSFQDTVSFGGNMLTNIQGSNRATYIVKYDSNGNVLWAEQSKTTAKAGGNGNSYSVATDKLGNSYITGGFSDTLSFGAATLKWSGTYTAFLVKYSPVGNVLWAKQSTGSTCSAASVITDGINPYITGEFENTIQFDSHTLSAPAYSIFVTKYDVNGNAIWAQQSSPEYIGTGLAADAYNHIYLTGATNQGQYTNKVSFGKYTLSNPSIKNVTFILELDTAGTPLCGSLLNNPGSEATSGIASDPLGNHIYLSSIFLDTLFYNGDTIIGTQGGFSTFVARWQSCTSTLGVASITPQNGNVVLYPNPSNGIFQLEIKNYELGMNSSVEVYNMLGEKVYSTSLLISNSSFLINLCNQPNGIYLYRVITETGELVGDGKLMIER